MKVAVALRAGGPVTLEAFADAHGLTMEVHERSRAVCESMAHMGWPRSRFYAHFTGVESKDGCILSSECGNGATPEEAIADYASAIVGKRLVHNADGWARAEFDAPNEWLPSKKKRIAVSGRKREGA